MVKSLPPDSEVVGSSPAKSKRWSVIRRCARGWSVIRRCEAVDVERLVVLEIKKKVR